MQSVFLCTHLQKYIIQITCMHPQSVPRATQTAMHFLTIHDEIKGVKWLHAARCKVKHALR
jgi:hypothetical protein